jgi:hypothetical protein
VESGDRQLGMSGSGRWKASVERTDRMLVYGPNKTNSLLLIVVWLSSLLL